MRYLGGKSRLAPAIRDAILEDTSARNRYIEPMVGGGAMLCAMAPHFAAVEAGDAVPDLVMMWAALQDGWEPPQELDEAAWRRLRESEPSAIRAFAGFGTPFGGRFFEGYARGGGVNYAAQTARALAKQAEVLRRFPVWFEHRDYAEWDVRPGDVVYLDPPYSGTKPYTGAHSGLRPFDHVSFWAQCRMWRESGAYVYVSEFSAPEDWTPIWSLERKVGLGEQSGAEYQAKIDRVFR